MSTIKSVYPNKYEVVSQAKVNQAIISKDANYYVVHGNNPVGKYDLRLWFVYRPDDGGLVSFAQQNVRYPSGNTYGKNGPLPDKLNLKSFKKLVKNSKR